MTDFKIGDKVKLFKKSEYTSNFMDCGLAIIKGFTYNQLGEKIFAIINTVEALKDGVIYDDIFCIKAPYCYIKKF